MIEPRAHWIASDALFLCQKLIIFVYIILLLPISLSLYIYNIYAVTSIRKKRNRKIHLYLYKLIMRYILYIYIIINIMWLHGDISFVSAIHSTLLIVCVPLLHIVHIMYFFSRLVRFLYLCLLPIYMFSACVRIYIYVLCTEARTIILLLHELSE